MSKLLLFWINILFMLSISSVQSQNFTRTWKNQLGSTLKIEKHDTLSGRIEGYYISPIGTTSNQYELVGWINEVKQGEDNNNVAVINFIVNWKEYGSLTSWTGYYEYKNGIPIITTQWHLARSVTNQPFEHILTGSDVFVANTSLNSDE